MLKKPKVLIFGIDGASFPLFERLINENLLPNLAQFSMRAQVSPLRSSWPPHTATGWPSIFSGRLPGEHGIFQFWNCQSPDYKLEVTNAGSLRCPCLWDVFKERGWKVGLINIPMSHPAGDWPGYSITWPLVPTIHFCQPSGLLSELQKVGGHVLPDIACMYDGKPGYPSRAIKYIRDRTKSVVHLLKNWPVEVVSVVYTELDRVCHHFWHGLDMKHPLHDSANKEDRNVIVDVFKEIDLAFGEILSMLDDDCSVLVVSDHGFGPSITNLRLHNLLIEGGFCSFLSDNRVDRQENFDLSTGVDNVAFDWENTDCYLTVPGSFGININLQSRQKYGRVKIADKEMMENRLIKYLTGLKDETNNQIFEAVVPGNLAYEGKFSAEAPDLLLIPNDPSLNILNGWGKTTWSVSNQTGNHRMEGIFMLSAQTIQPVKESEPFPIECVAGYLLAALGMQSSHIPIQGSDATYRMMNAGLPADAWSSVRNDSFLNVDKYTTLGKHIVAHKSETIQVPKNTGEILERLKALGYLG